MVRRTDMYPSNKGKSNGKKKKKEEPLGPAFTAASANAIIQQFETYEDYLDSQITLTDMFYLEDLELARQLVELGYRSNAEVMTRVEYAGFKEAAEIARLQALRKTPKKLFSANKDLEGFPFLKALAEREAAVATSKLTLATIIFVRDFNPQGHEISGYIDYGERLKTEDLEPIFERKKKLLPTPSDLSYYNWDTKISFQNHSQNWQVIADGEAGILFKNKKDRKVLNREEVWQLVNDGFPMFAPVDPSMAAGDLSKRIVVKDPLSRSSLGLSVHSFFFSFSWPCWRSLDYRHSMR